MSDLNKVQLIGRLGAEDRAALIEFLQRFPLPPTGQDTENE